MVDRNRKSEMHEDPGFEQELRQALAPRDAPQNFAVRVMQQIPPDGQTEIHPATAPKPMPPQPMPPRRALIFLFPPAFRFAAVAAVLVVIFAGSFAWHQHQRRIAGEQARQQVMTALQITHATLEQVADNVSSIQNRKDIQP